MKRSEGIWKDRDGDRVEIRLVGDELRVFNDANEDVTDVVAPTWVMMHGRLVEPGGTFS